MRSEDRKPSRRVFPLLQNLDLDSVTFAQIQGVGDPITIEDMNEQEMYDLVLVNLARLVVSGEWSGLLSASASFPLEAPAGSVSAPSYSFSGDTNTGIYSGVADHIKFATGGVANVSMGQDGGITEMIIYGQSGNSSQITTDAGTAIYLSTGRGTDSGTVTVNAGANANIVISPNGTGKSVIHSPQFGSSDPPASAGATGTAGQLAYDASYLYICTATDTWERVAVAAW